MSELKKVNTSQVDFKFDEVESAVLEFEEHVRKVFNNQNLKIGFSVFDKNETISLEDYLIDRSSDYGDFLVYAVNDINFDSLKHIPPKSEDRLWLAKFSLNQLDGCCGICVMFGMIVNHDYRFNKIGHYLLNIQKTIAFEKDLSTMICTDVINNKPQKKILKKFGFLPQFVFQNRKTKNHVELQMVDLTKEIQWKKKNLISQKFQQIKKLVKKIFLRDLIN